MTERIVRGMPMQDYLAAKALSAGGAWLLSEACPAKFWHSSPWNPDRETENRREFDIGTALHLAVLEPDALADAIVLVVADDFRTKAARDLRDEAYATGKTPLLEKHLSLVVAMDRAIHADPVAAELLGDGDPDDSEVSFFWEDEATGTRCKARVDRVAKGGSVLVDLKTAANASPRAWQMAAARDGHFLRAAFYLDGWEQATRQCPQKYAFLTVEKEPPHVVQIYYADERALAWGRMIARRACVRFAECEVNNLWCEGYSRGPLTLGLPTWAEFALADREAAGEFTAADSARSMEWLAP